jgi:hypothetical protein
MPPGHTACIDVPPSDQEGAGLGIQPMLRIYSQLNRLRLVSQIGESYCLTARTKSRSREGYQRITPGTPRWVGTWRATGGCPMGHEDSDVMHAAGLKQPAAQWIHHTLWSTKVSA